MLKEKISEKQEDGIQQKIDDKIKAKVLEENKVDYFLIKQSNKNKFL